MMKKGSALLVVLGMLAFMVISAVAFSAWMRSGRLPNSYLRRASASRLLAKAALAAAIDDIDVAIGDNLHPGFGSRKYSFRDVDRVRGTGDNANRNIWAGRVFIGQKVELDTDGRKKRTTSDNVRDHLISPSKTVSTLTLEGLAYIPPPFVSEARYYSRLSSAATWHDLAFDAGRYAFSAIDVSDCFDVNTLAANVGRSTTPYGRISLAYLFENGNHNGSLNDKAKEWDDFINEFFRKKSLAELEVDNGEATGEDLVDSSKVPLTSVADLNLAVYAKGGATGVGTLPSPFSKYVETGASSFYGGVTPVSKDGQRIRGMAFVADTWFPSTTSYSTSVGGSTVTEIDLADKANQPFPSGELAAGNNRNAMAIAENSESTCAVRLRDRISRMGLVLLHDYLDADDVPVSLALPSVERTPMVVAIKHQFGGAPLQIKMTDDSSGADPSSDAYPNVSTPGATSRKIRRTCTYAVKKADLLDGLQQGLNVAVAYPFRRGTDVSDPDTFTVEAHVDFFLSAGTVGLRTGNKTDVFHNGNLGDENGFLNPPNNGFNFGVLRLPFQSKPCTFTSVRDETSAVKDVPLVPDISRLQSVDYDTDACLLQVTWEMQQTATVNPVTGAKTWSPVDWNAGGTRVAARCGLSPINGSGTVDGSFANDGAVLAYLNGTHGVLSRLRAAVTVRIKNGDGRTVDIVPGGLLDDKNFNNLNNIGAMEEMGNVVSGKPGPMLLLSDGSGGFVFGDTEFAANPAIPFDLQPKGMMCADPRWNWAPEHWYQKNVNADANGWLNEVKTSLLGQNGRDRDIFMMTSDIGRMQSVYELACLPRLTTLENYGNDAFRGNMDNLNGASYTEIPAAFDDTMNRHLMWMTYNPYYRKDVSGFDTHPTYGECKRDPFVDLNIVNRGHGFALCPFSDATNVVLAAFANTPTDWWSAGVDPQKQAGVTDSDRKSAKNFNMKYAFNEYNANAKFAWKDIEKIAGNFISAMHDADLTQESLNDGIDAIWQDAYDENLNWSGDVGPNQGDWHNLFGTLVTSVSSGNSDLDAITDDLYDVDRKFLYGYWRECFAAKQQLFLVFVRAEPAMMGGGAVGAVPPQLAARAVALVWRDPNPTPGHANDIKYPHKTRVLFYRQLD